MVALGDLLASGPKSMIRAASRRSSFLVVCDVFRADREMQLELNRLSLTPVNLSLVLIGSKDPVIVGASSHTMLRRCRPGELDEVDDME